jgi:diguanylate cyclase (GGDEF)-like protein
MNNLKYKRNSFSLLTIIIISDITNVLLTNKPRTIILIYKVFPYKNNFHNYNFSGNFMARLKLNKPKTGKKILLVDDKEEYLSATASIISHEGHDVICAKNGEEALQIAKRENFDLILLDYYMPGGMTGEETVLKFREFNKDIQIILQTGYAGEYPPREMLKKLDIQGYHDKSDGPDKLLLWIDVGLKSAFTINLLNKSKLGLRYILNVTPDLHKIQQIDDLLQGILYQISGLIGTVNTFLAVLSDDDFKKANNNPQDGFIAIIEEAELIIKASTGNFSGFQNIDSYLENEKMDLLHESMQKRKIMICENKTIVPLCVGEEIIGIIYLDKSVVDKQDIELLNIFANQAAVAIQNAKLYEMATLDPLTGVYVRRFFDQCLIKELRTSLRLKQPLTLFMIDMDGLKKINDNSGHLAGDKALSAVGYILKQATRHNDFVGRYGGDEFSILLPLTSMEKTETVINRIIELLKEFNSKPNDIGYPISLSIGICGTSIPDLKDNEYPHPLSNNYFSDMANEMIKEADKQMYLAKKNEDVKFYYCKEDLKWLSFDKYFI